MSAISFVLVEMTLFFSFEIFHDFHRRLMIILDMATVDKVGKTICTG